MPFTLEDGTGVDNSNAYASVGAVDNYLNDRGRIEENGWDDKGDDEKEACIIAATDYIEQQYSRKFVGRKSSNTQGLSWPRYDAYDEDGFVIIGIPKALINATAEYAVRAAASKLAPDPSTASRSVKSEKKKVGSLEKEVHYITSGADKSVIDSPYPAADKLISSLLKTTNYRMQRS